MLLFFVFKIWYVTGILLYLSIRRLMTNDFEVESNPMMIVAACAVVFNIVLGLLLHGAGHGHSHGGGSSHSHKQVRRLIKQNTVTRRKPNVRFGKPN